MESWHLARAELNMQVSSMEVQTLRSSVPCTMGFSFGFETDRVWVDQGCQADFLVTVDCELLENNSYLQHNLIHHFSWIE